MWLKTCRADEQLTEKDAESVCTVGCRLLGRESEDELSLNLPERVEQRGQATQKPCSSQFLKAQYGIFKWLLLHSHAPKTQDIQRKTANLHIEDLYSSDDHIVTIFKSVFFLDVDR